MLLIASILSLWLLADPPTAHVDVGQGPELSASGSAWEVELKFEDPQRIDVLVGGRSETYWYVVYTAVNVSSGTQRFQPSFQIVTENLRVHDADMGISPHVFDAIRERHRMTHPYLVSPTQAIGELRVGDDYARESVAIWRQIDLTVNNFTLYAAGLSGETRLVRNPAYTPKPRPAGSAAGATAGAVGAAKASNPDDPPRFFTLRKTLEVRYTLSASPPSRETIAPRRLGVRWVMR